MQTRLFPTLRIRANFRMQKVTFPTLSSYNRRDMSALFSEDYFQISISLKEIAVVVFVRKWCLKVYIFSSDEVFFQVAATISYP